jgi:ketosteroid isomerase-like protein
MSQENVETVRAAFEASGSFLSAFGEDVEMHASNWGLDPGVFRGQEAIRTWLRNWIGTWDDYEAEAYEYLDAGPHVVVEQMQRGRNKRTGLPLNAATGTCSRSRTGRSCAGACTRRETRPSTPPGSRSRRCRGRTSRSWTVRNRVGLGLCVSR